jgi:hypothetical protein
MPGETKAQARAQQKKCANPIEAERQRRALQLARDWRAACVSLRILMARASLSILSRQTPLPKPEA